MAVFKDLISRTITRLSMVPGYGVQTYAEDQIGEMIYHKFVTARDEAWWDDLMTQVTITVDADGVPLDNIVRELPDVPDDTEIVINAYRDIQHVWPEVRTASDPLLRRPRRAHPNRSDSRQLVAPHDNKVFYVHGGSVNEQFIVRYRKYYPMFDAEDIVPFDDQLLILGAAWDYLEDDGANPMQIEKFNRLYVQRHDQLMRMENDEAISIGAL